MTCVGVLVATMQCKKHLLIIVREGTSKLRPDTALHGIPFGPRSNPMQRMRFSNWEIRLMWF